MPPPKKNKKKGTQEESQGAGFLTASNVGARAATKAKKVAASEDSSLSASTNGVSLPIIDFGSLPTPTANKADTTTQEHSTKRPAGRRLTIAEQDVKTHSSTPATFASSDHDEYGDLAVAIVFYSNRFKDKVSDVDVAFNEPWLREHFDVSTNYPDTSTVTFRIRLRPAAATRFLRETAERANELALFSPDPPYPITEPRAMNSAARLLLLQNYIEEVAFEKIDLPLDSDIAVVAFHDEKERNSLFRECFSWSNFTHMPEAKIREYYGDEVMFYFAWFNHYNRWLLFPASVGGLIFVWNYFSGQTVDNNPFVPVFSLIVMMWAVLFVKMWERRTHYLGLEGRLNVSPVEEITSLRRKFYGEKKKNPLTGQMELYYPDWKRAVKQPLSWLITFACLGFACLVQICSLNLQGYMNSQKHELFEIPYFDQFSHPGRIFDEDGSLAMVPVVVHSGIILLLNDVYSRIARALTSWENYRTEKEHEEALVIKRVFFEFIDCFASLFYVAFYRMDLPLLRQELISLFLLDQGRRMLLESMLPFLSHWWNGRLSQDSLESLGSPLKKSLSGRGFSMSGSGSRSPVEKQKKGGNSGGGKKKKSTTATNRSDEEEAPAIRSSSSVVDHSREEEMLPEYEPFEDYLEMVMQFGYVTMFASAFPLASVCALVGNMVEIRSDLFKFTFVLRRPQIRRAINIGIWTTVLRTFAFLAVISNVLLFGFTSNQMRWYFPSLFDGHRGAVGEGDEPFVVAWVFAIEHFAMLLVLFLDWRIPSEPSDVVKRRLRRQLERVAMRREVLFEHQKKISQLGAPTPRV